MLHEYCAEQTILQVNETKQKSLHNELLIL